MEQGTGGNADIKNAASDLQSNTICACVVDVDMGVGAGVGVDGCHGGSFGSRVSVSDCEEAGAFTSGAFNSGAFNSSGCGNLQYDWAASAKIL